MDSVHRASPRPAALSVVDQVTNQVVEMVLSGELEPGQPLPIIDLAKLLGVSHIPVREALRRLQGDGLVEYQRGKGAQVAPVSEADLRAVFALRKAIEADLGRRSVPLLDETRLAMAEKWMDELRDAMTGATPAAVSPAHRGFHTALLPAASAWDSRVLSMLWNATERYIQLYLGSVRSTPSANARIIAEHERLLAVAKGERPQDLSQALADHVTWSEDEILPGIAARPAI